MATNNNSAGNALLNRFATIEEIVQLLLNENLDASTRSKTLHKLQTQIRLLKKDIKLKIKNVQTTGLHSRIDDLMVVLKDNRDRRRIDKV